MGRYGTTRGLLVVNHHLIGCSSYRKGYGNVISLERYTGILDAPLF